MFLLITILMDILCMCCLTIWHAKTEDLNLINFVQTIFCDSHISGSSLNKSWKEILLISIFTWLIWQVWAGELLMWITSWIKDMKNRNNHFNSMFSFPILFFCMIENNNHHLVQIRVRQYLCKIGTFSPA